MKHIHHIIPRHMGGTNDPSNLIELTVAEHAQAHKELYEQHGKLEDKVAWLALSGQAKDPEFVYSRAILGGRTQGKRNAESGHMQKVQKLADKSSAGKKGGATTITRGKGSFADPVERLKSASKGGKTQGKRNADSGHLQRIAQLPNSRNKGKQWITNGTDNMMITKGDAILEGYRSGKTQKNMLRV